MIYTLYKYNEKKSYYKYYSLDPNEFKNACKPNKKMDLSEMFANSINGKNNIQRFILTIQMEPHKNNQSY